jgi:prefoldin subunit 5
MSRSFNNLNNSFNKQDESSTNFPSNKEENQERSMDLDPNSTAQDNYRKTPSIQSDNHFRGRTPSPPAGFGEDSDSENESTTSSSPLNIRDKGKGKEIPDQIKHMPVDWQIQYGRHRYKMFAAMSEIPGTSEQAKIQLISKALARFESFTSIRAVTSAGTRQVIALFGAESDAKKASKIKIDSDTIIHMQEGTIHNPFEAKHKTIRAWDIPLNVSQADVHAAFSKYGEIKFIRMQTIGMWQSANIEYTNQEDFDKLSMRWSIPFKADLIRIYPFLNTKEVKQERSKFVLRLINLPPGTTGYDMRDIIRQSKAQTCYIPRNNRYLRKRFAILSFRSQEALDEASNLQTFLGNTELQWLSLETKTCTICSNPNHSAKDCPIKEQQVKKSIDRKENTKKFGHLYLRYKPVGTSNTKQILQQTKTSNKKSYADVIKQRKQSRSTTQPLLSNPSSTSTFQPSLKDVITEIHKLHNQLSEIQSQLSEMDKRVGDLETDAYYYHSYEADKESLDRDYQERIENSEQHLSTPDNNTNQPIFTNYHRKRRASSPAADLRQTQENLHSRINAMGETLETITSTLMQFAPTQNEPNSDNTIPSQSDQ